VPKIWLSSSISAALRRGAAQLPEYRELSWLEPEVDVPLGRQGPVLETDRLRLRPWRLADDGAALGIYGNADLVNWLSPAMTVVPDVAAMRSLLQQWIAEAATLTAPAGRWALESRDDGRLVGAIALLPLPPGDEDSELGYQVLPQERGSGFAAEAARGVARWAFSQGLPEVFIVARPGNHAGIAVAKRLGFQWVGETTKYYELKLQIYRLRPADLAA
jgi:RimJ/RimL family protein N-acetyltransferase